MNKAIDIAADLDTPSSMSTARVNAISGAVNGILADAFALAGNPVTAARLSGGPPRTPRRAARPPPA
jgi:hypothetical protein